MNIRAIVTDSLPLAIRGFELTDPVLTIFGEGWSLNLMCAWVVGGPSVSFSWESEDIEDQAWELVGRAITGLISGPEVVDPKFLLSGGVQLSVQADNDFDPWTLTLPTIVINGRQKTQVQTPDEKDQTSRGFAVV